MDDLTKFLNFLYDKEEGYVYVATKDTLAVKPNWNQEFFEWPKQEQAIHDYVTLQGNEKDVYIAPALFKGKNALKKTVKGSNVVWVEFDGQEQIDFDKIPRPDCIVQSSSSTHLHCYWKIPFSPTRVVEEINRRLTYHLEADSSGWDANQVLRPPNSKNWKHDGLPVRLSHFNDKASNFDFASFDSAPEIPQEVIVLNSGMLLEVNKLLEELPLPAKLKKRVMSESVSIDSKARSSFLMKIGYELAEEGCNHLQIVSLLNYVDQRVKKFEGRQDKLTRLSEIASKALLQVEVEEGLNLYSPFDVINHKEDLEWIIPGLLHSSGFCIVTGAPGTGKTTLCLQMMYHLATAKEFLSYTIEKPQKILFISLEMNILELKYTFSHHYKEFGDNQQWDESIQILDQDTSFLNYEEIIADTQPTVVLIDSLSELAQVELKEDESRAIVRWIKRVRRRYNCAFVVIHHNRKDRQGNKKLSSLRDLYGSFIFGKDVDTVINMDRELEDLSKGEILFHSLKTRYSREFEETLTQDTDTLIFSIKENNVSTEPGPATNTPLNFEL